MLHKPPQRRTIPFLIALLYVPLPRSDIVIALALVMHNYSTEFTCSIFTAMQLSDSPSLLCNACDYFAPYPRAIAYLTFCSRSLYLTWLLQVSCPVPARWATPSLRAELRGLLTHFSPWACAVKVLYSPFNLGSPFLQLLIDWHDLYA